MSTEANNAAYKEISDGIEFLKLPFTYDDAGLAARFCSLNKDILIQIEEEKDSWASWNGLHWDIDEPGQVLKGIERVEKDFGDIPNEKSDGGEYGLLLNMQSEYFKCKHLIRDKTKTIAEQEIEDKNDPVLVKINGLITQNRRMKAYVRSMKGVTQMMKFVGLNGALKKSIVEFDSKGHYIGVKNGVLNLHTCELSVDNPEYLITKSVNAVWNLDACCPEWEKIIMCVAGGDLEFARCLQRIIGSMLLEEKKDRFIVAHSAKGGYYKSTVWDTVLAVLGVYAQPVASQMIIGNNSDKSYYIASLRAKRGIIMNETDVDAYLAGALVKQLVDSGPMQARHPMGRPFEIDPRFTTVLVTNSVPDMGDDEALWRRMLIVPFENAVPMEKRDPKFRDNVLLKEADGIFAWMVEGCLEYQKKGFAPVELMIRATAKEKLSQAKLDNFIDEFIDVTNNEHDFVSMVQFRHYYEEWSKEQGCKVEKVGNIKKKFVMKGFVIDKQGANVLSVFGVRFKVCPTSSSFANSFGNVITKTTTLQEMREEMKLNVGGFKTDDGKVAKILKTLNDEIDEEVEGLNTIPKQEPKKNMDELREEHRKRFG